jgi:hypothetical protein
LAYATRAFDFVAMEGGWFAGLSAEEWLAYVKWTGDNAKPEYPCCVCGAWFCERGVVNVTGQPTPKIVVRYLNTTLAEKFICRDRQCKSTFSGTSFFQLKS